MDARTLIHAAPKSALAPAPRTRLQRKNACEKNPGFPGESDDARAQAPESGRVRLSYNFADLQVRPPENLNSAADAAGEDVDTGSAIENVGSLQVAEGGDTTPLVEGGQGVEGMKGAAGAKCPAKTVVEKVIDMTPAGIQKGYRTGYGATALMRVEPASTNWDGTRIVEANSQTKNTCPKEFGISPCSGADTFTVGAALNSSILGNLPATSNHFYDFHITRWNKGSLLHDRNPNQIDTCETVCEQKYSCSGNVIGTHTVTRTFTKGKSGSRDVTLVNVTKG
ncbi:MAG: hypothetical protein ABSB41_16120 [Anaerolineales bacterium]|jgi:hypothetical protein